MAIPLLPAVAPEITEEDREQKPWKYIGYRGYCRFLASDDDFFFLRRFGVLHARVLLALQDQITVLEDKLDAIDQHAGRKDNVDRHNGSFRLDDQDRLNLISEIHTKLKEYSTYLSFDRPALLAPWGEFLSTGDALTAIIETAEHGVGIIANCYGNVG